MALPPFASFHARRKSGKRKSQALPLGVYPRSGTHFVIKNQSSFSELPTIVIPDKRATQWSAQSRNNGVGRFHNPNHSPFSRLVAAKRLAFRRLKVPEGRMRVLSRILSVTFWPRHLWQDPHPPLRATFPRRGKGDGVKCTVTVIRNYVTVIHRNS